MYECTCPECGGQIEQLSISETENEELQKAFNRAARWIYSSKKTDILSQDINEKAIQPLLKSIHAVLQDGFRIGIKQQVPPMMKRNLSENIYLFSGAKTYAELKELSGKLLDDAGNIKSFSKFWQDVQKIYPKYNQSYLESEYVFATQSAQMASKWSEYEADGDRYNLQYRTAKDELVRESHRLLHDTTLPISDPFWDKYLPPNGWRCRCTTVQVRKGKYPESDSRQAQRLGEQATGGKNSIFRFNPGKQQIIFPENHPYFNALNEAEKTALNKKIKDAYEIKTADDVVKTVNEIAKDKGWFERGFNTLQIEPKKHNNGSTDMNGTIWLNKERMDKTITGINKLSKRQDVTPEEADAMATFWHEITHNRNKKGNMHLTEIQRRYMELANEFIARNTLPEFYDAFGVKIQYPDLMTNRLSTGYNTMVRNYQKIIEKTGVNKDVVVRSMKTHLFNEKISEQKTGLENALKEAKKANGSKFKKSEINQLIKACGEKNETSFEKYLDNLIR